MGSLTPSGNIARITCPNWRKPIYAIVETGGKQYKVEPGQTIRVERLPKVEEGATVELDHVLMVADGDKVSVGRPLVAGAKVVAKSLGELKEKKIVVFKYKPKTRYQKKTGHRQFATVLQINDIKIAG